MSDWLDFIEEENPLASVIVIAWKSAPHLRSCLRALSDHVRDVPYEVVLILNEPEDDLVAFVDHETSGLRTITTRVNVGYGGAVNLGVTRSRGEFVVLLNDDTEVCEHWLAPLIDTARRRPQAGAVGSTTLFLDGSIQEAGSVIWSDGSTIKVGRHLLAGSRKFDFERRVDHCSGTSLLVRRSSWDAIGGMDAEAFYPAYYEDTDFCLRLIEHGEEVWYQPRSYVRHLESASTNSSYRRFLFERNQAVFVSRWRDRLRTHVEPVALDESEIGEAVWRAMGRPVRVLVLGVEMSESLDMVQFLGANGRCHVTVWSEQAIADNTVLATMGVGIAGVDDLSHVSDDTRGFLSYDLVVDLREPSARDLGLGIPIFRSPSIEGGALMVEVDGWVSYSPRLAWLDVVKSFEASIVSVAETVGERGR